MIPLACDFLWTLQAIIEDSIENNKELNVLYLDFQKAYDKVEWKEMIRTLEKMKIPIRLIKAIEEILSDRSTIFHTPVGVSEKTKISRGLPQGDPMSTILFNIFINTLLYRISEKIKGYVINEGLSIPLIAYADDLNIITGTKEEMLKALQIVQEFCDQTSFEVNAPKSCLTSNRELQ